MRSGGTIGRDACRLPPPACGGEGTGGGACRTPSTVSPSRSPPHPSLPHRRRGEGVRSRPAQGWPTILLAGLLALAPTLAHPAERLTGDAIRRAFEGNTVSGRYTNGGFFTEFHDQNGQATGHNGWQENTDACWTTKPDQVCYYYGPQHDRTVHCFTVDLTDRLYVLREVTTGRLNAVATVEIGNPRKHSDKGNPWYCDGLISRAPGHDLPMSRRRLAAR